ncbi:Trypanosoma specific protein, unknown function [Trypanosoma equiperdum]|nr:Trypanosoma specific protein, unknown function [Trypanosoma equiperdum]
MSLSRSPEATRPTAAVTSFRKSPIPYPGVSPLRERCPTSLLARSVADTSPLPNFPPAVVCTCDPPGTESVSATPPLRDVSPSPQHLMVSDRETESVEFGCRTVVEREPGTWGGTRSEANSVAHRSAAPSMVYVSQCSAVCDTSLLGQTCLCRRSSTNSMMRCGESLVELQLESGAFSSRSQEGNVPPNSPLNLPVDFFSQREGSCSRVQFTESSTDGQLPMDLSCVSWGHSLTTPVGTTSPVDSAGAAGRACGNTNQAMQPSGGVNRASKSPCAKIPAVTTRGNYQLTSRTAGRVSLASHRINKSRSGGGPHHSEHSVSWSPAPRNPTCTPQEFAARSAVDSGNADIQSGRCDSEGISGDDAVRRSLAPGRYDDSGIASSATGESRGSSVPLPEYEMRGAPHRVGGFFLELPPSIPLSPGSNVHSSRRPAVLNETLSSEGSKPKAGLCLRPQSMLNETVRVNGPKTKGNENINIASGRVPQRGTLRSA